MNRKLTRSTVMAAKTSEKLLAVFHRLYARYGPQGWWPGESPFEMIVGAILTQAAAWRNVERAIANLKAAGVFSPQDLHQISREELGRLLRPVGYFNAKAHKLQAFLDALYRDGHGDLARLLALPPPELRERLLAIHGIGPETADAIILYAAGKPSFVVDAYTRRVFHRLGLGPTSDAYEPWRSFFMESLPADASLFNEYHALIDRHAKETCWRVPLCDRCCMREICPYGQSPP